MGGEKGGGTSGSVAIMAMSAPLQWVPARAIIFAENEKNRRVALKLVVLSTKSLWGLKYLQYLSILKTVLYYLL